MDIGAAEHDVADERHRRERHEDLGSERGITALVAEKTHAQQDEQHQHSHLGNNENDRHGKGGESLLGKAARPQKLHDDDDCKHTARDGDRPTHDAQHAEHLQQQGHLRLRLACGIDRAALGRDHLFPFPMRHDAPFSNAARLMNTAVHYRECSRMFSYGMATIRANSMNPSGSRSRKSRTVRSAEAESAA